MIVVDTNVLVYATVQSPQTASAQQVAVLDSNWVVPPLWRFEFTSAITTLVRGRALNETQAIKAIGAADQLASGREMEVEQLAAFRAAIRYDLSAYDGQYIALAERLNVQCVTGDARMLRNVPIVAVSVADFVQRATPP